MYFFTCFHSKTPKFSSEFFEISFMNRAIYVNVNGKKKITGIQTRNENICHCLIAISLFYGPPYGKTRIFEYVILHKIVSFLQNSSIFFYKVLDVLENECQKISNGSPG